MAADRREVQITRPRFVEGASALGLGLLAGLDDSRSLVQAFAHGGMRLVITPMASLGRPTLYQTGRRTVTVALEATYMRPGTVATPLPHRGAHARRYVGGRLAGDVRELGGTEACYADELRASPMELAIWQTLRPAYGKIVLE